MTADKQAKLAARRLAAAEGISYAAARRRLRETAAPGPHTGIRLPYAALRYLVPKLPLGQVAVLASRTSVGKTTIAMDIARHAAAQGFSVLVCSQLNMRETDLGLQGLPRVADVPYRSLFWERSRIGMLLHRPEQVPSLVGLPPGEVLNERPGEADVFVVRNTGGPTGTATLGFELDRYRFTDLGRPAARRLPWEDGG